MTVFFLRILPVTTRRASWYAVVSQDALLCVSLQFHLTNHSIVIG